MCVDLYIKTAGRYLCTGSRLRKYSIVSYWIPKWIGAFIFNQWSVRIRKDPNKKYHFHRMDDYIWFSIFSDSLLATLLDAVRSCDNQNVHVRMTRTPRGKRVVPLYKNVDEETEASLLRLVMHNYQYPPKRYELLERFNANIPHSGLNYSVTQDVCTYPNTFTCTNLSEHIRINPFFLLLLLWSFDAAVECYRAYSPKIKRNWL